MQMNWNEALMSGHMFFLLLIYILIAIGTVGLPTYDSRETLSGNKIELGESSFQSFHVISSSFTTSLWFDNWHPVGFQFV